jgi:hypothetical protein
MIIKNLLGFEKFPLPVRFINNNIIDSTMFTRSCLFFMRFSYNAVIIISQTHYLLSYNRPLHFIKNVFEKEPISADKGATKTALH